MLRISKRSFPSAPESDDVAFFADKTLTYRAGNEDLVVAVISPRMIEGLVLAEIEILHLDAGRRRGLVRHQVLRSTK